MALTTCSDCKHEVSTTALACPNCGAPQKPACPRCGALAVEKVKGLKGAENLIALILLPVFVLPGLAYYFDRTRFLYCTNCKHRVEKSSK